MFIGMHLKHSGIVQVFAVVLAYSVLHYYRTWSKSDIGGFEYTVFGITVFLLAFTILIIWIPICICVCQINLMAYGQHSSAIPTPSSFSPTLSSPVLFPRQEVKTGIHDGIQVSQNFSVSDDLQYTNQSQTIRIHLTTPPISR